MLTTILNLIESAATGVIFGGVLTLIASVAYWVATGN